MVKRIAIIGPHATGKTSLIHRYLHIDFSDSSYIGTIVSDTNVDRQNNIIWDTPGQLRFFDDTIRVSKKVEGFILCFSPSDSESFHMALNVLDQTNINNKPVVIAATKTDILPFEIKTQWSSEAAVRGHKIIRTSSATNNGITQIFNEIFSVVEDSGEVDITRLEYAREVVGSCIYSGINNYIYELHTTDS